MDDSQAISNSQQEELWEILNQAHKNKWVRAGKKMGFLDMPVVPKPIPPPPPPIPWPSMHAALEHLKAKEFNPSSVLDIGAGKGYWSEFAQYFFPNAVFYLIDPIHENESRLKELQGKSNAFKYFIMAAGNQESSLTLHVTPDFDGSSLLAFDRATQPEDREVKVRKVDSLLAENLISPPQLVKIDVQGFERKVLDGGQLLFDTAEMFIVEVSLFEFMPETPLAHEIISYFASRNYVIFDIAGHLRRPHENDLGQMDIVFCRRNSPLRGSNSWK